MPYLFFSIGSQPVVAHQFPQEPSHHQLILGELQVDEPVLGGFNQLVQAGFICVGNIKSIEDLLLQLMVKELSLNELFLGGRRAADDNALKVLLVYREKGLSRAVSYPLVEVVDSNKP